MPDSADRGHFDRIYALLRDIQVGQGKLETSVQHVKDEQGKTSLAVGHMAVAQATMAQEMKDARDDIRRIEASTPAFLTGRDLADPLRRIADLEADRSWLMKKLVAASLGSGGIGGLIVLAIAKLLNVKIGG